MSVDRSLASKKAAQTGGIGMNKGRNKRKVFKYNLALCLPVSFFSLQEKGRGSMRETE